MLAMVLTALVAAAPLDSAGTAMQAGEYMSAAGLYHQAIEQDSSSYQAWFGYARALAFAGEHEAAVDAATELLRRFPDDPDGLLLRGRVLAWLEHFEAAEADLLKVTALTPGYTDAWSALADLYRWWGKPEMAGEAAEKEVEAAPESPKAWLDLARARMARRAYPEAREALAAARKFGADPAEVDRFLAQLARVPSPTLYELAVSLDMESISYRSTMVLTPLAAVKRQWQRGSLILGAQVLDATETGNRPDLVAEGYLDLWRGAYGNLRVIAPMKRKAPLDLDAGVEVFQSVAGRFEAIAGWRQLAFGATRVNIGTVGGGAYLGRWYLRARLLLSRAPGSHGIAGVFAARRYVGSVDDYLDATLYLDRDIQNLTWGGQATTSGWTVLLRGQKQVDRRNGLQLGVRLMDSSAYDLSWGVTAGFYHRF